MKKLLLFARDPGGANVIQSLLPHLTKEYKIQLYGKDVALERFCGAGLPVKDIAGEVSELLPSQLKEFLQKEQPDLVITGTSADDNTEKYLWHGAEELEIPSIAILDQWINYGIRFSKYGVNEMALYQKEKSHEYLPTKICVMDIYAKQKMMEEGIGGERIAVTGQPYLSDFAEKVAKVKEQDKKNFRQRYAPKGEKLIVFASEPLCSTYGENCDYWGYTERSIFRELQELLTELTEREKCKISVIVRPHPKENMVQWKSRLKDSPYVAYYLEQETDNQVVMSSADLIVGMSSMFLLESTLCRKPVLSLQIGLRSDRDNPFILEKIGVLQSAVTREAARGELEIFLKDEKQVPDWEIPMDAAKNIRKVMEELL
ncbi:MAG: hypothetical protein K2M46_00285 [Lachnospiraceae bacterium]|nr:hypothetical protein [Lachnospiraceae bacterium]